jgi:hypothetical protein
MACVEFATYRILYYDNCGLHGHAQIESSDSSFVQIEDRVHSFLLEMWPTQSNKLTTDDLCESPIGIPNLKILSIGVVKICLALPRPLIS